MSNINAPIIIRKCTFIENHSQKMGGVIYIYQSSRILIENCIFTDGEAKFGGAIFYDELSTASHFKYLFFCNEFYFR